MLRNIMGGWMKSGERGPQWTEFEVLLLWACIFCGSNICGFQYLWMSEPFQWAHLDPLTHTGV